jgi:hypothetical protein
LDEAGAVPSQELELFAVALAPNANGKVKTNEQARPERQRVFHGLRQQTSDVVAMGSHARHNLHELLRYPVSRFDHLAAGLKHGSVELDRETTANSSRLKDQSDWGR